MVTASHNPPDYNGMKFVREQAAGRSAPTPACMDMRALIETGRLPPQGRARRASAPARHQRASTSSTCWATSSARSCGRSRSSSTPATAAPGWSIDQLEPHLPFEFIKLHHEPDGTFPQRRAQPDAGGEPRQHRSRRCARTGADVGLAWDGDFDRCFFFDEHGGFIEGYYLVGPAGRGVPASATRARASCTTRASPGTRIDIVRALRRQAGAEQVRPRLHQADDARGGRASTAAR